MTFVIVHFNTPLITTCLLSSIYKHHPDAHIIIFENSTFLPMPLDIIHNFHVDLYDNSKEHIINFGAQFEYANYPIDMKYLLGSNNLGSAKHAFTIDWLLRNLKCNEFILCDSDILFKKPINWAYTNKITVGQVSTKDDATRPERHPRILPYCQYFNVKLFRQFRMHFFDYARIIGFENTVKHGMWAYDTGASFYEDVKTHFPRLYNDRINLDEYIVHYKAGSWDSKTITHEHTPEEWVSVHKRLWAHK